MIVVKQIPRRFLFEEDKQEIILEDPSVKFQPEAVLNFYSNTYPVLTTAKIEGPEIVNDYIQYRFISTIGTKG